MHKSLGSDVEDTVSPTFTEETAKNSNLTQRQEKVMGGKFILRKMLTKLFRQHLLKRQLKNQILRKSKKKLWGEIHFKKDAEETVSPAFTEDTAQKTGESQ